MTWNFVGFQWEKLERKWKCGGDKHGYGETFEAKYERNIWEILGD